MSGNIGRSPAAPLIFPPSPRLASDARRLPAVTERMGLNKDLCRHPLAASTFQPVSQTSAAEVKAPLAPLPLRPPRLTFDSTEGAEVTIDLPFFLRPHFLSPVMYLCPSCQSRVCQRFNSVCARKGTFSGNSSANFRLFHR